MKIACTGPKGRVGKFMVQHYGLTPLSSDITDDAAIAEEISTVMPDVILHCAGLSDPDFCEDPKNSDKVMMVNYWGAVNVFRAAAERKIITVYLSSSQVFSGKAFLGVNRKYKESDILKLGPVNHYGLSKLTAEAAAYSFTDRVRVVRTSHLFDYFRMMDKFHDKTIIAPTFIKRSYMYLPHFGHSIMRYMERVVDMPPVLHIAGTDTVSEYELCRQFKKMLDFRLYQVKPRRHEVEGFAPRPHFSGLDVSLSKSLGLPQYSYIDGLQEMNRSVLRG